MTEITHSTVPAGGITMHIAEAGSGRPVILVHGFPELWYTWRRIIPIVADAGYHVVAPDMRGYGQTEAPEKLEDYDIAHLTNDLLGLLDELGEEKAVFVGHDWGATVVWSLAQMHPDRVEAVVGMSVPFTPRPPMPMIDLMKAMSGDRFNYFVYFQERGRPEAELSRDLQHTFKAFMWSISGEAPQGSAPRADQPAEGTGILDGRAEPPTLPEWLTQEDVDYFVAEFGRTGFTGALNWYRNLNRNWELMEPYGENHINMPSLFITGERDPVRRLLPEALMEGWLGDLRDTLVLPGTGHWAEQERPAEVSAAILGFLKELPPHS